MTLNLTNFDGALKQHYTDETVDNLVYADNPLFAMMGKMEQFGGRNLPIPSIYGDPQARSVDFTQAQTRSTQVNSRVSAFLLTRTKDYSLATIDNETIEASKGDANAFLEAATVEIDGAINSLTRSQAVKMYGDGSGQIAQVANSSFTTSVLSFSNPEDVVKFEVGDVLVVCSSASSAGSVRSGSAWVIAVDRSPSASTVTVGDSSGTPTNLSTLISAIAQNDFIFHKGDAQNGAATPITTSGVEAWTPAVAPGSSDSFFGVNRSIDVSRYAGSRWDGTAMSIREALLGAANLVGREGGKLTHYFVSFKQYTNLENELSGQQQYVNISTELPNVGFRGMVINGAKGAIKVIPDQNCPTNRAYGMNLAKWKLCSLGKAIRVIDTDGLQMLRQGTADGVEVRYGFYGNVGCWDTRSNVNVQLSVN